MKTKRILYLLYFDGSETGGHASHARGVVCALARQGCEVKVIAPGWPINISKRIEVSRVWQWKRPRFHTLTFMLFGLPIFVFELLRYRPTVIYARYFNLLFVFALFARLFRAPLFVEYNADVRAEHRIYGRNVVSRLLHDWGERLVLIMCTGAIAVTDSIVESWSARWGVVGTKAVVLRNGVDDVVFRPRTRDTSRYELSLSEFDKIICYAGSFSPSQGLPWLIDAFIGVIERYPNALLLLVGGAESQIETVREGLAATDLQRIRVVGWVDEPTLSKYIGASDICVAPYAKSVALIEGQAGPGAPMKGDPLKIYSYMACARPVVASHFREAGQQLERIGAGLAVPPEDVAALCRALDMLLRDEALCAAMGAQGRRYVEKHATWNMVASKTIAFMGSVLSRDGRTGDR